LRCANTKSSHTKRKLDALHGALATQCLALAVWIYREVVGVRTSE
jgi:hypothetical protein